MNIMLQVLRGNRLPAGTATSSDTSIETLPAGWDGQSRSCKEEDREEGRNHGVYWTAWRGECALTKDGAD
jgi:hypothetical protein